MDGLKPEFALPTNINRLPGTAKKTTLGATLSSAPNTMDSSTGSSRQSKPDLEELLVVLRKALQLLLGCLLARLRPSDGGVDFEFPFSLA